MIESEIIKFFAFGCWNLGGCSDNAFLNQNVNNIIRQGQFDFGLILGDNIYKNVKIEDGKKIKEKDYNINTLVDGIICINKINVPLYVTLGNHDVEECSILAAQLETNKLPIAQRIQNLDNWNIPSNYYMKIYNKGTTVIKLISLDSNLFDYANIPKEQDESIYSSCKPEDIKKIKYRNFNDMMIQFATDIHTNNNEDFIIIFSHVPLVSLKPKKLQKLDDYVLNILFNTIETKFKYSKSKPKDILYICADTHNYQNLEIHYNDIVIKQYVLGTGGATPDSYKDSLSNNSSKLKPDGFIHMNFTNTPTINIENTKPDYKIKIIDGDEPYGYGLFEFYKDKFNFEFKKVNT